MSRKEELLKCLGSKADEKLIEPMIDEIIFLEAQLEQLKKLPFIKIHPKDPTRQKATPAARLYTQLSAQYNSAMRTLVSLSGGDSVVEESPLREWAKNYGRNAKSDGGVMC